MLSGPEQTVPRLNRLNLTEAQRGDAVSYEPGYVVEFHQRPEPILDRFGQPDVVAIEADVFPAERGDVGDKPPCYWTRAACRPPRPPAKPRPDAQCSTAKFKRGILPGPLAYVLEQILR